MTTLSIIVPAYNAADTLHGCLRAILALDVTEPYEVILVDDGSKDNTAQIAGEFGTAIRLIRQAHAGAAAARNTGIRAAKGDIILFTDADCEPVRDWATRLVEAILAGASGAKGTYRTHQRSPIARFVQAEYESKYRRMQTRAGIDFIDTYSAAYLRSTLLGAGGFNENLPVDEDQELSFRLAEAGHLLVFVPQAIVYHHHVTSLPAYIRRKFRIGYWKVFVGAMHPERIVSDSHTPQSMKLEMLLAVPLLPALAASPFFSIARWVATICAAGFALSTVPFVAGVVRKDPIVAVVSPFMLLLRALGLGIGVLAGTLRLVVLHVHNRKHFQVQ